MPLPPLNTSQIKLLSAVLTLPPSCPPAVGCTREAIVQQVPLSSITVSRHLPQLVAAEWIITTPNPYSSHHRAVLFSTNINVLRAKAVILGLTHELLGPNGWLAQLTLMAAAQQPGSPNLNTSPPIQTQYPTLGPSDRINPVPPTKKDLAARDKEPITDIAAFADWVRTTPPVNSWADRGPEKWGALRKEYLERSALLGAWFGNEDTAPDKPPSGFGEAFYELLYYMMNLRTWMIKMGKK